MSYICRHYYKTLLVRYYKVPENYLKIEIVNFICSEVFSINITSESCKLFYSDIEKIFIRHTVSIIVLLQAGVILPS